MLDDSPRLDNGDRDVVVATRGATADEEASIAAIGEVSASAIRRWNVFAVPALCVSVVGAAWIMPRFGAPFTLRVLVIGSVAFALFGALEARVANQVSRVDSQGDVRSAGPAEASLVEDLSIRRACVTRVDGGRSIRVFSEGCSSALLHIDPARCLESAFQRLELAVDTPRALGIRIVRVPLNGVVLGVEVAECE